LFSTRQRVQQSKAEEEKALADKLAEEGQQEAQSDEMDRLQRKVYRKFYFFS